MNFNLYSEKSKQEKKGKNLHDKTKNHYAMLGFFFREYYDKKIFHLKVHFLNFNSTLQSMSYVLRAPT